MKRIVPLISFVLLLSGCSLFTEPPSEAKARKLEEGRASVAKDAAIQSRAGDYKKGGLGDRDANAAAESEYAKSGAK